MTHDPLRESTASTWPWAPRAEGGDGGMDELDMRLVTLLQDAPRAEWSEVGAALGVDPSTAARRWARLADAGHAWFSCYPVSLEGAPLIVAFVEVDCAPGRVRDVAVELAGDPHVFTVEQVTGARDLVLTCVFDGLAELARYTGMRVGTLPGVAASRTQIATAVHMDGSRWRLDRPTTAARLRLARAAGAAVPGPGRSPVRREDQALVRALADDPRQPVARLARRTGLSPTTVRRRLRRLDDSGALVFRCEVARGLSGWPVSVSLWCAAPPKDAARIAAHVSGLREVRLVASLSGPHNLLFAAWLRSIDDIHAFESQLTAPFPGLTVADRAVTLWPVKLAGHLLDPTGRRVGAVPLAGWDPGTVASDEDALLRRLCGRAAPPSTAFFEGRGFRARVDEVGRAPRASPGPEE
ncbi:Lrp/AsnC family transcriptional regulator [Streptomyces sp. NPDC000351]|uniref:Lrp/AsnC family transcriptional regulator n=1 Tax=Streptomyces sp. NPDC000351 TaxID=3154250 RepID=UPI003331401C